jgi:tRNA uridine 5-carbamoylmethylation protein Kti12
MTEYVVVYNTTECRYFHTSCSHSSNYRCASSNWITENIYPTTEELLASLYHKYEEPASEKIHSELLEAIKRIENIAKLEKGE